MYWRLVAYLLKKLRKEKRQDRRRRMRVVFAVAPWPLYVDLTTDLPTDLATDLATVSVDLATDLARPGPATHTPRQAGRLACQPAWQSRAPLPRTSGLGVGSVDRLWGMVREGGGEVRFGNVAASLQAAPKHTRQTEQ